VKACRVCGRLYPDEAGFCPVDGQELYSATQVPVQSDDDDPRVGQLLLERYEIRRVVADGGMGRVYEALDLVDRRSVALKVLHPDVAKDEVSVQRFKREFEVSQELPHDHIVEVLDFQPTPDKSYVLVMEFLYGEELRATLKRSSTLKPERVVRMLSHVALGLDEAHARKLVHRDLKPDNLFLCQTSDGDIVKVLDFGSVKDKTSTAKKLTVVGTTIGSPYYMAPEQAQGLDTLDHRADVWALAAIAYECITGTVPFKGVNGPSILLEILTKEPVPASQAAASSKYPVPPTIDRALSQAMKKSAAMRTPSVGALADAVGHAYGLEGDHNAWAIASEESLGQQIAAKIDSLMAAVPQKPAVGDNTADSFFGEDDSLGVDLVPAGAGAAPLPSGSPLSFQPPTDEQAGQHHDDQ
jgi:serine/threonine-protein kinase